MVSTAPGVACRQNLPGTGKIVGEVLAQLLVAAIYFHAGILHHALCFFYKVIALFSGFEQEEADAVFAVINRLALIIDHIEFFGDGGFDTNHGVEFLLVVFLVRQLSPSDSIQKGR
jgi:hypothetical protein